MLFRSPFLSITPNSGVPISVFLRQSTETIYTGSFEIAEYTPTGTAYAVFSARDLVGNRGSEIDVGASIEIDTNGPAIVRLVTAPGEPIQNDQAAPVTVNVEFDLNEIPQVGTQPELGYLLSAVGRIETTINNLDQIGTYTWRGSLELPADAGFGEVETLSFTLVVHDDLGNISNDVTVANQFQVYQGGLPPLRSEERRVGKECRL